jgi:hypothetical protein
MLRILLRLVVSVAVVAAVIGLDSKAAAGTGDIITNYETGSAICRTG